MTKFNHLSIDNLHYESATLSALLDLYIEAFPSDERREWFSVDDIVNFMLDNSEQFNIIIIYYNDCFAGFMTYWDFSSHIYIEHLAIMKRLRSISLGSKLLKYAIDTINSNIILEVEHPTTTQNISRINFYSRLGFTLRDDIPYIQPPYSPRLSPTPLILMTHGNITIVTPDDDIIANLKRIVYNYTEPQKI